MLAVTASVLAVMTACWGASVAATSSETSVLTVMTEPPAAPALLLLATDTGLVSTVLDVLVPVAVVESVELVSAELVVTGVVVAAAVVLEPTVLAIAQFL